MMKSNLFSFEKKHLVDDQLYPWSKPPRTLEASFDKIHLWWSTRYKVSMMYLFAQFRRVTSSFLNLLKNLFWYPNSVGMFWHIITLTLHTHTYISIGKRFYGRNRYLACIETEKFGWEIDQVQRSAVPLYWLLVSLASHNRLKSFLNSAKLPDSYRGTVNKADGLSIHWFSRDACKHDYISWKKKNAPSEMI